jgi:hypothetical protein
MANDARATIPMAPLVAAILRYRALNPPCPVCRHRYVDGLCVNAACWVDANPKMTEAVLHSRSTQRCVGTDFEAK